MSKPRDPEANCRVTATRCSPRYDYLHEIRYKRRIRYSNLGIPLVSLRAGVLVAGDCVHTRLPHSFKKKTPAGQREEREEGADRAGPFFPAIDRTNNSRYLQCTYCSLPRTRALFLSLFLSLFQSRTYPLSSSRTHFPAICLPCRLYLTATEIQSRQSVSYHTTRFHVYSP